jgi:RNA polymerase sigma factor (TIGR02999 family)
MRGRRDATLEPSALVNECWIRIGDQRKDFQSRSQFLAIASRIMLRVLLDADRRRASLQRGGDRERVTLSFEIPVAEVETGVETRLLHEALEHFDAAAPRKAEVARLRGLAGLTTAETALELGVSSATVERDWAFARAWLSREVQRLQAGSDGSVEVADPVSPEF